MENSGLCLENERSWVELPGDVSLNILMRVDQIEIVECAQFVCKPWYDLCKEPSLWRSIRFKNLENPFQEPKRVFNHEKMVFHAIDRSAGGLIDLDIMDFVPYKLGQLNLLNLNASGSLPKLQHLQFIGHDITNVGLMAILDGCPLLQSLDLSACIHLVLEGNLWTRLSKQVKYLLLPYDPTLDYYYPTLQDGYDFDDVCYVDTDFDAFYG
ncbi:hypothetical protein RND81_07G165800 [Saponaria officinalis]|uniref:F-box domain-containing protein n=1 Tax=Saponaria officinalis TaxID=3572 RepID=A0AAW1JTF8_SAPOF